MILLRKGGNVAKDPCEEFDRLLAQVQFRKLTAQEIEIVSNHWDNCPSGKHTTAALEEKMGLPQGAFENGSPEHGMLPARELEKKMLRKICKEIFDPNRIYKKLASKAPWN